MPLRRGRKSALPSSRVCGYTETRAAVVVEARPFLNATESTAMIIIGILLCIAGLGALCWLLFNLAVFALPLFAAVSTGLFALHSGAGPIAAIVVGFLAGLLTLAVGQAVFTLVPSPLVRGLVALIFAAPAAFAGFHATHGLAGMVVTADGWRQALSYVGGAVVGLTALTRLLLPIVPPARSPATPRTLLPAE